MPRYQPTEYSDKCSQCGGAITVEMNGPWTYRVCARNGHVQGQGAGAGPLASAVMLYSARGQ